jgi:hypothetical protein
MGSFIFKILEKSGSVKAPDQVNLYNRNDNEVMYHFIFLTFQISYSFLFVNVSCSESDDS